MPPEFARSSSSKVRARRCVAVGVVAAVSALAGPVAASDPGALGLAYDTGWAHDENSGDGYAYARHETFVDCAHTRVGARQSADLLAGAYAHGPDGRVRSYADMGVLLENDALRPGELAAPDKVQLYGQASTASGTLLRYDGPANARTRDVHVACDTPLALTFWVAGRSELDLRYDGVFIDKRTRRRFAGSVTARLRGFVPADGWSATCARCAVRRAVTLAVGDGPPERPGSFAGIRDIGASREPAIPWTHSIEGRYLGGPPGDPRSYALRAFTAAERDIVDSPPNARRVPPARPAFLVSGEGRADERVGLDER